MTLGWRVRLLGAGISHTTGPVATVIAVRRQALRQRQAPQAPIEYLNEKRCAQASSIDSVVPTPDRGIPVQIYQPAGPNLAPALPIVIAFHGGGWVSGDLSTAEWLFGAGGGTPASPRGSGRLPAGAGAPGTGSSPETQLR